jgi:large subunit ribosomal protein L24
LKLGSPLSETLREKYRRRSLRPRKGDSVRIVKGEFKDIEGKVTRVIPEEGALNVEGVNREKVKGGNSPVPIKAANVILTGVTLEDKKRKKKLEAGI